MKNQKGLTLLEISLAATIGIIASIGMYYSYNAYNVQVKMDRGKLLLNTLRNSVNFYKQTCGFYPTAAKLINNDMTFGGGCGPTRPFFGDNIAATNPLPIDPFKKVNTVMNPNNLADVDDAGGWIYNPTLGTVFVNLADDEVQYGSNPSTW